MGRNVDEEVVRMQFDNAQFQRGVQDSIASIDSLNKKLNCKSVGLDQMANDINVVKVSFSALEVAAFTVFSRITNAAIDTGKRVVNALAISPVMSGFQEYETQINAVQTILANTSSKGTTLNQVNEALDELNRYADMTIYNFTEMTRNIGTFTAAGVDLDTSVQAIKGIANLAAVSGSTSQQASTAMYQLSQALAAGTVKLMDWNSVVNAGMGGQVFQDALMETARVHGVKIDEMIAKEGSFRETLKHGWLTASTLTETLAKFTGDLSEEELRAIGYTEEQIKAIMEMGQTANDAATKVKTFSQLIDTLKEAAQSGWTQTWEILIGDFEEAKELLTKISDAVSEVINNWSNARNAVLQNWKDFGGRTMLLEALENSLRAVLELLKPIGEAFKEIFPPITSGRLIEITKNFLVFSRHLGVTTEMADALRNAFRALFLLIYQVGSVVFAFAKGAFMLLYNIGDLYDELLFGLIGLLGKFIFQFLSVGDAASVVAAAFDFVNGHLRALNERIDEFMHGEELEAFLVSVADWMKRFAASAKTDFSAVADIFANFIKNLRSMDTVSLKGILDAVKQFVADIHDYFTSSERDVSLFTEALQKAEALIRRIFDRFGIDFDAISNKIGATIDAIKEKFEQVDLGAVITASMGAGSIFALYKFAKQLSSVTSLYESVVGVVDNVSGVLESVQGGLEAYTQTEKSKALVNYAKAIAFLAGSIAILALLDTKKVLISAGVILVLAGAMTGISVVLTKWGNGFDQIAAFGKMGVGIALLAASISLLVKVFQDINSIDLEGAALKVMVITTIGAALGAFAVGVSKYAPTLSKSSVFFISAAIGIRLMVGALKSLEEIDGATILKAIPTFLTIMTSLAVLAIVARKTMTTMEQDGMRTKLSNTMDGFGILALVFSLKLMISAIKDLGTEDPVKLTKGLIGFVGVVGAVSLVFAATRLAGANATAAGAALFQISLAINLLVLGFKGLAKLDAATVRKASDALSQIVVVFGIFTALTRFAGPSAAKAGVAILALALAIDLLIPAIWAMGTMDPVKVQRGVNAVSQILVFFGILVSLTKFAGKSKSLARTINSLSIAMVALSASLVAISMIDPERLGPATLALDSLILMLGGLVASTHFMTKAKMPIILLGVLITALGVVLHTLSSLPVEQVLPIAMSLGLLMMELTAALVIMSKAGEVDIKQALKSVAVLSVLGLVVGELSLIAAALTLLDVDKVLPIIFALGTITTELTGAMFAISKIRDVNPVAVLKALGITALVLAAIGGIVGLLGYLNKDNALSDTMEKGLPIVYSIADAIGGFVGHLAGSLVSTAAEGLFDILPIMGTKFTEMIDAVAPGLKTLNTLPEGSASKALDIALALLAFTAADFITGIKNAIPIFWGESSIVKMGEQLEELGPHLAAFFESTKNITPEQAMAAVNLANGLAEFAANVPNTGGLIAKIVGDNNNLAGWGAGIKKVGESLADFAETTKDIDANKVEGVANAAKLLANFNDNIPESGGKLQAFFGEKNMEKFGEQLAPFGKKMALFAETTKDIDTKQVEGVANAAKALAKFNDNIPASGGNIQGFFGEKDMAKFGRDIVSFGISLRTFATTVGGITEGDVTGAINAGKSLSELNKALPSSGSIFEGLTGKKDLGALSAELSGFGMSLASFFSAVSDIGSTVIDSSLASIQKIIDLLTSIQALDRNELHDFGVALKTLAQDAIKSFTDELGSIKNQEKIENIGKLIPVALVKGIKSNMHLVRNVSAEMGGTVETSLKKRLDMHSPPKAITSIGEFISLGLGVGMTKKFPDVWNSACELGDNAIDGLKDALGINGNDSMNQFYQAGSSSMGSLARGISSNNAPVQAAKDKATEIADAFQEVFDQIDLFSNRTSLEQQLYEAMYQDVEGMDIEKLASEITSKSKLLDLQNEKLMASSLKYQAMLNEFGAGSTEAQTAYNDYLQVAIDVANATSELKQKQNELAEAQMINGATEEAQLELYQQYLQENMRDLSQFGFTYDQLEADARKRAGLPVKAAQSKTQEINNIVREGATAIFDETGKVIDVIYDDVKPRVERGGAEVSEAYAEGMVERSDVVAKSGSETAEQGVVGIESEKPGYAQAGVNATDAYVDGMQSNIEKVAENAAIIAQAGYESAMSAIQNMQNATVNDALKQLASVANGAEGIEIGGLSKVDDIERLISYRKEFQRNVDIAAGMSGDEVKAIVRQYEKESGSKLSQDIRESDRSIVVGSIIQNNFSSRQLDRDGVYRDTKSLFNNIGGTVNAAAKAQASSATKDSSK